MDQDRALNYPKVVGEFDTVREILKGYSIARFGDGEVKIIEGFGYIRQPSPPIELSSELKEVSLNPAAGCLIGIPTLDPRGVKYENWLRHRDRLLRHFSEAAGIKYYSSFITRPDSAQWIECAEYHDLLSQVWRGKRITIVSEPHSKILTFLRATGENVSHIECPRHEAYSKIRHFERTIAKQKPDIALLSCGVTATCLANRLTLSGIQAVDIGSVGGFLMRWFKK